MQDYSLRAGVARQIISPPPGIYLIGYGNRTKGNRGIHDDLTATALVLDDRYTRLAIVACDILCLNEFIVDRIRSAVEPHLPPILCCSHTHSGPIAYADEHSPPADQRYIEQLMASIQRAIQEAAQNLKPAYLTVSKSQADIAVNRREHTPDGKVIIGENPSGEVDRSVHIISVFNAEDKRRMATLVNFACHGTVLGPDNLLVSADWIGAMRSRLETALGGLALFLQGATGNLNPKMGWGRKDVWEMVQSQGERVAEAAIRAEQDHPQPLVALPLKFERQEVWLPLEAKVETPEPPPTYRKRILVMAGLPTFLWPVTDFLLKKRYPWRSRIQPGVGELSGVWTVPLRINTLRMGELALVTYGSETFTEIGLQIKADSPAPHTLFASVTDGCIGYLPTVAAHAEGGYEVDIAPYAYRYPNRLAANSAEIAIHTALQALKRLYKEEALQHS